jgi:predicted MFS family arabinose efflux permease
MLIVYPLTGIGTVMVNPMTRSLVGNYILKEKRASVISLMFAGGATIYLIGGPFIRYLEGIGGWRLAFIAYAVPISFASSVLAFLWVPRNNVDTNPKKGITGLLTGFHQVFSNPSAIGCLIGGSLAIAAWSVRARVAAHFIDRSLG